MKRKIWMKRHKLMTLAVAVLAVLLMGSSGGHTPGSGIEGIWLWLEIDGSVIEGDSTVFTLERENTIEVGSLALEGANDAGTHGGLQFSPIKFRKAVDRSSPLLMKALHQNQHVDFAQFRAFRPNPTGDGSTQQYYTILGEDGRITKIRSAATGVTEMGRFMEEEVQMVFTRLRWTFELSGVTHEWDALAP